MTQKEIYKLKQVIQKAEYSLKFHECRTFKELKEDFKACKDVTNSVTTFLKFVDPKYDLTLVVLCKDAETDRQRIRYIKEYGTEYGEWYKVLAKSISLGNALSSLIDVKYKQKNVDIELGKKILGEVEQRIEDNFPERDNLLHAVILFLSDIINQ